MNKKDRYIIATLFLILAFSASSCGDSYLDLKPNNKEAEATALTTVKGCWKLLNGIHRLLYTSHYNRQYIVGQGYNTMLMDILGEDMLIHSRQDWFYFPYIWSGPNTPTSAESAVSYYYYYSIISNANMLIDNAPFATGSEKDKNIVMGQAHAYRAWAYFQMIRLYGERFNAQTANKGLGLRITLHFREPVTPRATVLEVYAQIEEDLNKADELLEGYSRSNKSHLNQAVAKGLKARMYLTQQNWNLAATYAAETRKSVLLMDSSDYMSGFNDYNNKEWIWGSHQQQNHTTYFASFFAFMSCNFPSLNINVSPRSIHEDIYKKIPRTDVRWHVWDSTGTNKSFPVPLDSRGEEIGKRYKYMHRKFRVKDPGSSIGDLPLMRAAEMYLIEAEALARMNRDEQAATVLHQLVATRDKQYQKSTKTGNDLIDEILFQRRIELWGEGFRFYDLKRLNQKLDRDGHTVAKTLQKDIPAGDRRWQFAIPQQAIDASKGVIVQNPL